MIIADRLLKLRGPKGATDVSIRLFSPEQDRESWASKYEIDWPGATRKGVAVGVDPMQAVLFALQMIGAEIYTSDYHKSGSLAWEESGSGYGFPVPRNLRDLLVGDDAKFL